MRLINLKLLLALLAGIVCTFGFAPFGYYLLHVLALAALVVLVMKADKPRCAGKLGFMFGLGMFSVGTGWIYVALHDYGGMPLLLAATATLLFSAFLSLFAALGCYFQARLAVAAWQRATLLWPATWVVAEWVRGTIFTGFPWLNAGYAHSDSALAGYAPLFGVYGISLVAAVSAGLLALLFVERTADRLKQALFFLMLLWLGGAMLREVKWTRPAGDPFSVALIQGNIPQNLKFNEDAMVGTLETYRRLALESNAQLTVLPETAIPLLRNEIPPNLIEQLRNHARSNGGDLVFGAFERNNGESYNSVFTLGSADEQRYRKHHLVIFGEFIPLRPLMGWFINDVLDIPMGDLGRGGIAQPTLQVAGQQVAPDICYEDVFGEEIIGHLPQATILLNLTNDAWYGDSYAADQHNQISRMRALESGRMMLRATNTGVTSVIASDGKILQQLPQHQEAVLRGNAQGYAGATPYVVWGNTAAMLIIALMLGYLWALRQSPDSHVNK
ncbi:MAG: apolipoprotein N-acyltransferase [Gallionella sp.]